MTVLGLLPMASSFRLDEEGDCTVGYGGLESLLCVSLYLPEGDAEC